MEQFGGVGFFALDPQKNFESRGSSQRRPTKKVQREKIDHEKQPSQPIVPDGRQIWAGSR